MRKRTDFWIVKFGPRFSLLNEEMMENRLSFFSNIEGNLDLRTANLLRDKCVNQFDGLDTTVLANLSAIRSIGSLLSAVISSALRQIARTTSL